MFSKPKAVNPEAVRRLVCGKYRILSDHQRYGIEVRVGLDWYPVGWEGQPTLYFADRGREKFYRWYNDPEKAKTDMDLLINKETVALCRKFHGIQPVKLSDSELQKASKGRYRIVTDGDRYCVERRFIGIWVGAGSAFYFAQEPRLRFWYRGDDPILHPPKAGALKWEDLPPEERKARALKEAEHDLAKMVKQDEAARQIELLEGSTFWPALVRYLFSWCLTDKAPGENDG